MEAPIGRLIVVSREGFYPIAILKCHHSMLLTVLPEIPSTDLYLIEYTFLLKALMLRQEIPN